MQEAMQRYQGLKMNCSSRCCVPDSRATSASLTCEPCQIVSADVNTVFAFQETHAWTCSVLHVLLDMCVWLGQKA